VIREDFREQPPSTVDVALGHEAVIKCRPPRGDPEPRVRWVKDGQPLPAASSTTGARSPPTASSGAASSRVYVDPGTGSLHVQDVRREDAGKYVCIGFNGAGDRESTPARLNVRGTRSSSEAYFCVNDDDDDADVMMTVVVNFAVFGAARTGCSVN
jgi:hypothetical protein